MAARIETNAGTSDALIETNAGIVPPEAARATGIVRANCDFPRRRGGASSGVVTNACSMVRRGCECRGKTTNYFKVKGGR